MRNITAIVKAVCVCVCVCGAERCDQQNVPVSKASSLQQRCYHRISEVTFLGTISVRVTAVGLAMLDLSVCYFNWTRVLGGVKKTVPEVTTMLRNVQTRWQRRPKFVLKSLSRRPY